MKTIIKNKIIILLSSLLLALPIANALHFIVIDHTVTTDDKNNKIIHQCDDYLFQTVFDIHHPDHLIEKPQWKTNQKTVFTYYSFHYRFNILFDINNKGPPELKRILA